MRASHRGVAAGRFSAGIDLFSTRVWEPLLLHRQQAVVFDSHRDLASGSMMGELVATSPDGHAK
jgi:hypothetical protein